VVKWKVKKEGRMLAYRDLKAILAKVVAWEVAVNDFYDVAELALRNPESKKLVVALRDSHRAKLDILRTTDVSRFGSAEWVKYVPDLKDEELLPKGKISRDSPPREVFARMLETDEKLKGFYADVARIIVSRSQRELFESLAVFKGDQIESIKGYMASLGT
jgi:hypothetical protein